VPKAQPRVALQVRIKPESKQVFECWCAMWGRSQGRALETIFKNLCENCQVRLGPEGWQRFLRQEISSDEAATIFRKSLPPNGAPSPFNPNGASGAS